VEFILERAVLLKHILVPVKIELVLDKVALDAGGLTPAEVTIAVI
jgi:hypothetical protein